MNAAATAVMRDVPDIGFAYGISDEFRYVHLPVAESSLSNHCSCSFVFGKECRLFDRRER